MIRGGKIDMAILGAMEVAENVDLANWMARHARQGHGWRDGPRCRCEESGRGHGPTNKVGEPKVLKTCTLP